MTMATLNLRTSCTYLLGSPSNKKSSMQSLMTELKRQSILILFCYGAYFLEPFKMTSLGNVMCYNIFGSMFNSSLKTSSGFSRFLTPFSVFLCSNKV